MKKMRYEKRIYVFLMLSIVFIFVQSVYMQYVYGQPAQSEIKNVDQTLQYYINKFTPPPYMLGDLINSKERIIMEKNVADDDLKYLIFFTELKKLYVIDSKKVTDEGLGYLENLTNLEWLNLWGTNITIKGLRKLYKLKNIQHLELDGTNIVDEDLQIIAEFFPRLKILSIGENQIKGPGIRYLTKLKLEGLGLNKTHITDATVKYFAGFKNCEIMLHNTKVTEKGKAEILRITRNCEVSIKEGDLAPPKE